MNMAPWRNFERYSHHLHSACVPCGRGVVVHQLQWRQRFRYGGSAVPAMPSASGIRVFIHDEVQGDFSTRVQVFSMDWLRRALPQGVVRQCRAVKRHNTIPQVSERMTVVPTTLALFAMKLRVVARPE